jgi:hypothetical protein
MRCTFCSRPIEGKAEAWGDDVVLHPLCADIAMSVLV